MSFVGIICEEKNKNIIKQILANKIINSKILVINEESIENFKNITFETIVIISNNTNILFKKEILKNIIAKSKYLIINADIYEYLQIVNNMNLNIITYGFNSKSTVTASSVAEENMLICIQRNIYDIRGKKIETQEIKVPKIINVTITIGLITLLLLYGRKQDFSME